MESGQKKIIFPVSELNIKLDTNVGEAVSFNRGMIKLPKMSDPPEMTSELPFFTKYVRYPSDIQNADWKTRYEFFFNRDKFVDTLREAIDDDESIFKSQQQIELKEDDNDKADEDDDTKSNKSKKKRPNKQGQEWLTDTEKHNIMITLRSIFPLSDVFGTTLKNSYEHILLKKSNDRILYDLDIKNAFNFFGFMNKFGIIIKEEEEYFLNVGGKRYSIEDVMWENDIVNHPIYAEFLKTLRATFDEAELLKLDVEKQLNEFVEKLNNKMKQLIARQELKRRYILDVFQKIPKVKELMVQECSSAADGCQLTSKTNTFRSFDKKFKSANQSDFDKYLLSTKESTNETELHDEIKLELIKDYVKLNKQEAELENDKKIDYWNSLPSVKQKGIVKQMTDDLKNPDTIEGMIAMAENNQQSAIKYKDSRNAAFEPILEKLNAMNDIQAAETRDDADNIATIILSLHNINSQFDGSVRYALGEYDTLFESLVELAINVKAGLMAYQFVNDQKAMNLKPRQSDGKKENVVHRKLVEAVNLKFSKEVEINDKLSNSVNNIYEPLRKTSNAQLYCMLQNFKTGQLPADCDLPESGELDTSVFNRIYEFYLSEYLDRRSFRSIQDYLYVGVDQIQVQGSSSGDDDKKSAASSTGKSYEIYVRVDLVDADTFEKAPRAACGLYDKIITEEFKNLTDKRYTDGTILSKYRNLDFDTILPNSAVDIANAADTTATQIETGLKQEETQPPVEKTSGGNKKSRSRMKHTKRFRKNGKKRTLRSS